MEIDVMKKVPVAEQDPAVRATNFDEVNLGYTREEAILEASRCLTCKNARCIQGCPVNIDIPSFIARVKEGDVAGAYGVISLSSALPAVCGRVCPQETQCEAQCVRGIKGEAVSIGRLERFVADTASDMGIKPSLPEGLEKKNKILGDLADFLGSGVALRLQRLRLAHERPALGVEIAHLFQYRTFDSAPRKCGGSGVEILPQLLNVNHARIIP